MRRAPTEPKTAFAGVMLETSFARLMASMATLSEERTPSRPFDRCGGDIASKSQGELGAGKQRGEIEGKLEL